MSISEWCQPHALSRTDHEACKWSACDCPCGHPNRESGSVDRDSVPQSFANPSTARDNKRAKSDPALRQQPGSWPNSTRESDVTKSTRSTPRRTTPGVA